MCQNASRPHESALPPALPAGPALPAVDQVRPCFGGYAFGCDELPKGAGGLFVFTRALGGLLYPVLIGEAGDALEAVARLRRDDALLQEADGLFLMARDNARQRAHILRELIGKFEPPLNVEHRKGRAAPALSAFVPDRANIVAPGDADLMAEPITVNEDELGALVRNFYAQASRDDLIGPVLNAAIGDWEHHFDIVQDFWSRTLLGTQRYKGNPFAPHVSLNLKPEFFERWLAIFRSVARQSLQPVAAGRAIAKVEHMSECFQAGLFPPDLPNPAQPRSASQ